MNPYLEKIKEIILSSEQFSVEEKNALLSAITDADKQWTITDFKLDRTEKVKRTTAILLEQTIGELEEKRKAIEETNLALQHSFAVQEEKNHELSIEASLERVRTKAMAMKHSSDLPYAANVLFQQVQLLGISAWSAGYCIWDDDKQAITLWMSSEGVIQKPLRMPLTVDPALIHFREGSESGGNFYVEEMGGEALALHYQYLQTLPGVRESLAAINEAGFPLPTFQVFHLAYFKQGFLLFITYEPVPAAWDIFKRFANVFEQTYTRFLDLQNAEALAREGQIELGLERVRTRAMAMQRSEDLKEMIGTVFVELTKLDLELTRCIIMIFDPKTNGSKWWMANSEAPSEPMGFFVKNHDYPPHQAYVKAWKEKQLRFEYVLQGNDKKDWDDFLFVETELSQLPDFVISGMKAPGRVLLSGSFNNFGCLNVASLAPLSEEHFDILLRFAKVFDLTYTRFNDLKQAEAQARESQIEAGLERVRSAALTMHKSDDLRFSLTKLFEELDKLQLGMIRCGIAILDPSQPRADVWIMAKTNEDNVIQLSGDEALDTNFMLLEAYQAWKKGDDYEYLLQGDDLDRYYQSLSQIKFQADITATYEKKNESEKQHYFNAVFKHGSLFAFFEDFMPDEAKTILKRFSSVLNLAYSRFLDIQSSEAQAREARVETALERVRSRTMAMQKSDELAEVAKLLFKQVKELGIAAWTTGFNIWSEDNNSYVDYVTDPQGNFINPYTVYTDDAPEVIRELRDARKSGIEFFVQYAEGERLKETYMALMKSGDQDQYEKILKDGFDFPSHQYDHFVFGSKASLMFITYDPVPEFHDLFKRFGKAFEQTYTRFLDLQKAEAQAKEAQIELALERVRARTMAMFKSDELADAAAVLFEQLHQLGDTPERINIGIVNEEGGIIEWWLTEQDGRMIDRRFTMKIDEPIYMAKMYKGWKEKNKSLVIEVEGQELTRWLEYIREVVGIPFRQEYLHDRRVNTVAFFSQGMLAFTTAEPQKTETIQLLERFAKVFDLTYTRFLDLKKAEAQAREAQIEAAFERVRSRTMGMQKSDELKEVIQIVYEQFVHLNINIDHTGFVLDYKARDDYHIWIADKLQVPSEVTIPYFDCVYYNLFNEAKEKGTDFFAVNLGFEEKNRFYQKLLEIIPDVPEESKEFLFTCRGLAVSTVLLENVCLYIENFSGIPYSEEENSTLMRFGKVFQQTYTRFLDLQKAEAQARESQIEAALERVRSRAMAMQKTEELLDAADLVGKELSTLGINSMNVSYAFIDENEKNASYYSVNPIDGKILPFPFVFPHTDTKVMLAILSSWKKQEPFHVLELDEESSLTHQSWVGGQIKKLFDLKGIPFSLEAFLEISPKEAVISTFNFANGYLFNIGSVRLTEMQEDILLRITKVFDLTYRRFLDLKQAESQAREAQIELALERVRARTMAMQHSHELQDAAIIMFQQVQELGIHQWACGYNIWDDDKKFCTAWMSAEGNIQAPFKTPSSEDVFLHFYEAALRGEELFVEVISGETCAAHYQYLRTLPVIDDVMKGWDAAGIAHPTYQIFHIAYFKQGYLMFITYEPVPEAYDIFKRFAKVFEQTYTRFLDLEKAEAQALETVKRASVDRVRAEIASMRTTNDLEKITPLIWNELTTLGVPFIRCGVFIMDEEAQEVNTYLSNPEGEAIAAFHQPYNTPGEISEIIKSWRKKELHILHWDETKFIAFTNDLVKQGAVTSGEKYLTENRPTDLYLHFLPFMQGMLYAGNTSPLSNDALQLVQNLADAFSTAYARYEDFNKLEAAKVQVDKTLTDLKQTQAQLIQAEKMASLGELTAGIAHEIQNPLNFVNNFSEVNTELSEEIMQAAINGNLDEVKSLATDIKLNQEKIREHGKRADSIVKGMLQHTRSNSGEMIPTNINVLADEYLRLAYHGIRAKDKSFNAALTTDFDNSIGNLNIIPQDIGRVMLNLINNAFYAVAEKMKSTGNGYQPLVTVSSKKMIDSVEIKVTDNGNGIPVKVLDKIFQPFFTTKPTGQGTGLGLSLSYDIMKAHGGEMKVESVEGEGSCFTMHLPVNDLK